MREVDRAYSTTLSKHNFRLVTKHNANASRVAIFISISIRERIRRGASIRMQLAPYENLCKTQWHPDEPNTFVPYYTLCAHSHNQKLKKFFTPSHTTNYMFIRDIQMRWNRSIGAYMPYDVMSMLCMRLRRNEEGRDVFCSLFVVGPLRRTHRRNLIVVCGDDDYQYYYFFFCVWCALWWPPQRIRNDHICRYEIAFSPSSSSLHHRGYLARSLFSSLPLSAFGFISISFFSYSKMIVWFALCDVGWCVMDMPSKAQLNIYVKCVISIAVICGERMCVIIIVHAHVGLLLANYRFVLIEREECGTTDSIYELVQVPDTHRLSRIGTINGRWLISYLF